MSHSDISLGCRILWLEGHEHFVLGHVSARSPRGGYIMKANARGLGETGPENMVLVDQDGHTETPDHLHSEAPIHTEIYRVRPDVNAVVHTHHWAVAAMAASTAGLEMVNQDSVFFWNRHATFDSADMITDHASGQALAHQLGDGRAVVLRNHGLVTVGASVKEAVALAVCLARSATVQLHAASFGGVVPMPERDLASLSRLFESSYEQRLTGVWAYLERMLRSHATAP